MCTFEQRVCNLNTYSIVACEGDERQAACALSRVQWDRWLRQWGLQSVPIEATVGDALDGAPRRFPQDSAQSGTTIGCASAGKGWHSLQAPAGSPPKRAPLRLQPSCDWPTLCGSSSFLKVVALLILHEGSVWTLRMSSWCLAL